MRLRPLVGPAHSFCADPCVKKTCPEFTRCVSDEYNTRAWCEETCEWNGKCADDEICEVVSLPVHEGCSKTTTCKRTDHCKGVYCLCIVFVPFLFELMYFID